GMSIVRQIRDASWNNFSSLKEYADTTYCIDENSITLRNPAPELNCGQNVGIFRREVNFEHDSSDCVGGSESGSRVTVKVSWSDNKCGVGGVFCHSVELISCFSNVDQKQAP
ncbi:MAG: hypothetical protein Q8P26_04400, partial [Candidatus Levybacteria bacterium]|nr:hypothetical protein [Candidatus Levybacteria bacterium]